MGGIWQYSAALVRILAEDRSNSYFVFHLGDKSDIAQIVKRAPNMELVNNRDVHQASFISKIGRKIKSQTSAIAGVRKEPDSLLDLICKKYRIDIIHCPYQFLPQSRYAASVSTLHDVQEIYFPEYFTAEDRQYRATAHLNIVRKASHLIVSYDHVKQDLINYFQADSDKVSVVLLDMDKLWFERIEARKPEQKLPAKFLLMPANVWKHKNHLGLAKAVKQIKDEKNCTVQVVCTGGNKEPWFNVVDEYLRQNNIRDQFLFVGSVSEEELLWYYKNCYAVVVPTLYEAGSFPLMEAILLHVPVVCSNVTSLPETIGDPQFLFDPRVTDSIASVVYKLWIDEDFCAASRENTYMRAPGLINTGALEKIQNLYSKIANQV